MSFCNVAPMWHRHSCLCCDDHKSRSMYNR
jgi:hypothetical protein